MNPYFGDSYSLLAPPGEGKVPVECSHAVPALHHGQVTQAGHGRLGQGHQVRGQDFLLEEEDGKHHGLRPNIQGHLPGECIHTLG